MSATWMPRAARLVATSVGMRPLRNPSSTRSRSCWPTLPWSARAGLPRTLQERDNARDVGSETKVEQSIRLIEHEDPDLRKVERAARGEVKETARRADDDVHSATERVFLRAVADAAIDGDDANIPVATEGLELLRDLLAKLARRYDDQREWRTGTSYDALEDRQREGSGLAGACLRLGKEIAARAQGRDREHLNGREGGPTELLHSTVEIGGKRDQSISFAG